MSTSVTHTPGPWSTDDADAQDSYRYVLDSNGATIARITLTSKPKFREEDEANARLIAAAPELLEALRLIRDARDYNAEQGEYPAGTLGEDQEFDDWAADVAEAALEAAGVQRP